MKTFFLSEVSLEAESSSTPNITFAYTSDEQVDGQAFIELSSSNDFEQLLQCKFTFGVRTKLKNIMAAICKHPSSML